MRVLLVRQGAVYGPEYVHALKDQTHSALVTLTDQSDTPGVTAPLQCCWSGWWAKLELFAPWNEHLRPALYIDLDSFVFGDITQYDMGDTFTMVEDFSGHVPANSSVMWLPQKTDEIWKEFIKDPEARMEACGGHGDQKFLGGFAEHLWKTPDDGIVSFKQHGRDGPVGNIMQFHGQPKMRDAKGWAQEYWQALTT